MSRIPLWLRVAVLVAALIAMLAVITFAPAKASYADIGISCLGLNGFALGGARLW